ncbi:MAG: 50S ribosomal protein L9 [Armatimonadota bacterium]
MKVIFLEDVDRVAHEGDVEEVADGFARNYLIPNNLAVRATEGALKELEQRRSAIEKRQETKREAAEKLAEQLGKETIVIEAPVGEGGRLHGRVTTRMIADAAAEQLEYDIDRRDIDIPEPISATGKYLVTAELYRDIQAQLPIEVVPDEESREEAEEAQEQQEAEDAQEQVQEEAAADEEAEDDEADDEPQEAADSAETDDDDETDDEEDDQ